MLIHSAPRPFARWAPPTRFATARDVAIFALCLLLIAGFIFQVLAGPPRRVEPVTLAPTAPCARA